MALTQVKTDAISDDAVTLAKQAAGTDGQIITYDASGNPTAVGPGTDGQVLTSTGAGSPPAFEDIPAAGAALTGSTNNTITTVTGANAIQGEANLTFDGNHLAQTTDASAEGFNQTASGDHVIRNIASSNRSGANQALFFQRASWNGNNVAELQFLTGPDTTNKDDGQIAFFTGSGGSVEERLRIDSSGDIGLGITNPNLSGYSSPVTSLGHNSTNNYSVLELTGNKTSNSGTNAPISTIVGYNVGGTSRVASINFCRYNANNNGAIAFNTYSSGVEGERLVIDNGGDVKVNDGNLVIGTSGHGIDFSATADGTGGAAELFNDYEEGEFTPSYSNPDSNAGFAQTHQYGYYTRIGNVVTVNVYIQGYCNNNAGGNTADNVKVTGLPFAPAQLPSSGNNRHQANWAIGSRYKMEVDDLTAYAYGGNTYIDLYVPSNGGTGVTLKTNQIDQNTTQFNATATYRV